jgi:predicted NBD/HSP70 family sugar kinase
MAQKIRQRISRKPKSIKNYNQKLILSMFRGVEELSIAEIATKIKLSKTTVTKVVNGFHKKGLLLVTGKGSSSDIGGKKPTMFAFNGDYAKIVVIIISTDTIRGAVLDMKCNLIVQRESDCPRTMPYPVVVERIVGIIQELVRETNIELSAISPLVIGCEGIIDVDNGILHYSMHHDWGQNVPMRDDIQNAVPFPVKVYVDNNLRLAGYVDMDIGDSSYDKQVVVITTQHSGGGCVLENQKSVHGNNGFVGEIGHMIIEPDSVIECSCGGHGCFGALVSPGVLLGRAHERCSVYPTSIIYPRAKDGVLTMAEVFAASNRNDPFACELMDEVIRYFAIVIHNITILRDPERITISGVYAKAGAYFIEELRKCADAFPFYKGKHKFIIDYSAGSNIDVIFPIGAAHYAVDLLLDNDAFYS